MTSATLLHRGKPQLGIPLAYFLFYTVKKILIRKIFTIHTYVPINILKKSPCEHFILTDLIFFCIICAYFFGNYTIHSFISMHIANILTCLYILCGTIACTHRYISFIIESIHSTNFQFRKKFLKNL